VKKGVLIALLWLAGTGARAENISVALAADGRGGFKVEGAFFTNAPRSAAWAVLSDYDRIDDFVASMRASRVTGREDGALLVEQEAAPRFLFFRKTLRVHLEVREEAETKITFKDVAQKDFALYEGSWRITDDDGGFWVLYSLKARPTFDVPSIVARRAFRQNVWNLLNEVRAEIARRNGGGHD